MNRLSSCSGAALLLVLWAIAVVSFAVLWLADVVNLELQGASSSSAGLRARQIALSGVAIGLHPQTKPEDYDLLNRDLKGGDRMEVRIRGEGARLNINRLLQNQDRITLKNLFMLWGLTDTEADTLIDKLIDWTDEDDLRLINGAERSDYLAQGIKDAPPNRPFRSVAEMERVPGMELIDVAQPGWAERFTVFGDGRVDVNEADAEILQAATALTPEMVEGILQQRRGSDGIEGTEDDFRFASVEQVAGWARGGTMPWETMKSKLTTESSVKRIDSRGIVGDRSRGISVVALTSLDGGATTYLLWEEN